MIATRSAAGIGFVLAVLCGMSAYAQAPAVTHPPAEAFAVLPAEPPRISPDGAHFALIRGVDGRPTVAVYKVDSPQELPQLIGSSSWFVSAFKWAKNDVLIIYDRKVEKTPVFGNLRPVGNIVAATLNNGPMNSLAGLDRIDDIDLDSPDTIFGSFYSILFQANVRTGRYFGVHLGPKPPGDTGTLWVLDGHGKVLGRVDSKRDEKDGGPIYHSSLVVAQGNDWRVVGRYDTTLDARGGLLGLSDDGNGFLRLAGDGKGTNSLIRIDMATGAETRLFQDPVYDVSNAIQDDWTGRVIGYVVDEDMPVYRYFDPKREALQKGLEQAFPGMSVHPVSTDLSGNKAIVEAVGPKTPASYYLYDRTTHHASAIAASYPELTENEMGEVKPYGYTAGDGTHIPAYLTLPPGKSPHNLPLVVVPHGGLDARDDMTFDFVRQFLTNRGYAVLQPEYRGSRGFGSSYARTGTDKWATEAESDISDGVRKAIAEGIADPKRICIIGEDFGGFASLAGAELNPELYACVVSFAGPSDLSKMLGYSKKKLGVLVKDFWATRIGDNSEQLDAASPVFHADHIAAPVLLLHCDLDFNVPVEQSEIMAAALQKAGKRVELVHLPGDDHYMAMEQTRLRVLQEIEKFLAANIGN